MSETSPALDDFRPGDVVKVIDHDATNPYGPHHFQVGSLGVVQHTTPSLVMVDQLRPDGPPLTQGLLPSELALQEPEVCS